MIIKVKRGTKASLPTLQAGELGFCTDTGELYVGTGTGNGFIGPGGAPPASGPSINPYKRNAIINGNFQIWQRGASFPSVLDSTYTADRWIYYETSSMLHSISQSTDVPVIDLKKPLFSLQIDVNTPSASPAASDYAVLRTKMEGYDLARFLYGRPCVLSMYIKAAVSGTYAVVIRNAAATAAWIVPLVYSTPNVWQRCEAQVDFSTPPGTWNFDHQVGYTLNIALGCGSSVGSATTGQWLNADIYGYTGFNPSAQANTIKIFGLQFERGDEASPIEEVSFIEELMICQRYYEKSFPYNIAPADAADTTNAVQMKASSTSQYAIFGWIPFSVVKRINPTMTYYNPAASNASKIRNITGSANVAQSQVSAGLTGFNVAAGAALTASSTYAIHWAANAEL